MASDYDSVVGFAPSSKFGQNNAGLAIYIAPGAINGVSVFAGGTFPVPANTQTYFWCDASGEIFSGPVLPNAGFSLPDAGLFPIARVTSGQINTGTNPPQFQNGVTDIVDLRPSGAFSFGPGGELTSFTAGSGLATSNPEPDVIRYSMTGGIRLAAGSGGGTYSTTSNTLVDVDSTNLVFSLPNAPVGYAWRVTASGNLLIPGSSVARVALVVTNSIGFSSPSNVGNSSAWFGNELNAPFFFQWIVGPTTTSNPSTAILLALQWSTTSGTLEMDNGTDGSVPAMVAELMPTI